MTYSTDQENEVSKIVVYLWIQTEGEDFNSNEILNLAGCTMKYGPLNRPIIAHVVTERCAEKDEVTLQLNYFFQVQKFLRPISARFPHSPILFIQPQLFIQFLDKENNGDNSR